MRDKEGDTHVRGPTGQKGNKIYFLYYICSIDLKGNPLSYQFYFVIHLGQIVTLADTISKL